MSIKKDRLLKSILDISSFTNFVENPELILGLIIEECVLLSRARWGAIISFDPNLSLDVSQITIPLEKKEKDRISLLLNNVARDIVDKNGKRSILEENFWNDKNVQTPFKKALGRKIKNILLCPIKKKDRLLGLAILINKKDQKSFTKKDQEGFSIICQEASIVIENINLFKSKLESERMAAIGLAISSISHYVKNILQGISSGSYLLNLGINEGDLASIRKAWEVVDKNTRRISDLVMDMLYYSKERKFTKKKTDPKALINDVAELLRSKMKKYDIEFALTTKELPDYIVVDEQGIHRSLLNIISNAIDACDKPKSSVRVEATFDKSRKVLKVAVRDNGKGMATEEIEKIFLPFYTKKGGGTGLGLAITKKVIEEHSGSIRVDSSPSAGTIFELIIPVS